MTRALRLTCWLLAILAAGLQAYATRYVMNPDALSYLDVARAILALDVDQAVSPYWGPLYPFLLAIGLRLGHLSTASMFLLVHGVNVAIFVLALAAFDFFLQELLRARQQDGGDDKAAISDMALTLFAYAVFLHATLALIGLHLVTPDLCIAAVVFAAAGLVLALNRRGPSYISAVLLGLLLGLGYLAKSVMFVLSLVLMVFLPLSPALRRRALRYAASVGLAFGTVAALLIIPISRETGRLTFGTSGKLTYAFMVNRVPYTNWQGDSTSGSSRLVHPPRRLGSDPVIFEYTRNLVGTYPAWFDPTYWNAGLRAELRPKNQAGALFTTGGFYIYLFLGGAGVLATLLVLLILLSRDHINIGCLLRQQLPILALGLIGLAIYLPINVETRYVAAFATLLWVIPAAAARTVEPGARVPWLDRAALACAACLIIPVTLRAATNAWDSRHDVSPHREVAAALRDLGIGPGDRVANIGIRQGETAGSSFMAFWAYLGQIQIAAEIPDGPDFLCAPKSTGDPVYAQLAQLGVRAAVTMAMPSRSCSAGWQQVQGTDYYVRPLERLKPQ